MSAARKVALGVAAWLLAVSVLHGVLNVNWAVLANDFVPPAKRKLNVAYIPVTCHLACPVTDYISQFSEAGEIFIPRMFQGFPEIKEALIANKMQAAFIVAPMAIALKAQGVGIRIVYRDTLQALHDALPLSEALARNPVPAELEPYPEMIPVFLLMRENVIKRLYQQRTGYWKVDGEGVEVFSRRDEAAALDLVAGGDADRLARAAASLVERGDFAMALRIADLGLAAHPSTPALVTARTQALQGLRVQNQFNPFKFIFYSERAGAELPPPP